ncbi:peroxiredoxin-like family protein [Cupriavidus pauculus]|uniref:thioredoxin-dependent peroxiredoxin n=1 Tax=Cupriavidus pauculus TaxID=82633 RepID=A0A2N5C9F6_9BURK|nr:peroxiredoxin-like family protein [Cupriavidus pauculus]PLP98846.1 alkyl hydroperoxide reductase [Cupriavidus pauculus]
MSLQAKLDAFKAALESGAPPYNVPRFVVDAIHRQTDELIESGQAGRARKAGDGDQAPVFSLHDAHGNTVDLGDLLAKGPVVVTFYRGVWCPYCNMDLQALEAARPEIEARGATMVAISMQSAVNSRKAVTQNKLGFPILNDPRGAVADAFGLRFALPDYLIDIYKNAFKTDLAVINDDPSWTLPMPARYIIGQDGVIAYAEVNPDYTQRPDPSELLPTLDRLRQIAA